MPGFSLKWYEDFFFNERWTGSLWMSFVVALATTALAYHAGHAGGARSFARSLSCTCLRHGLLISPMIVPVIIASVGMFKFYSQIGVAVRRSESSSRIRRWPRPSS